MEYNQLSPQLRAMLASPEAKRLVELLQSRPSSQQATDALRNGDETAAREALRPLLNNPEILHLLQQLSSHGG